MMLRQRAHKDQVEFTQATPLHGLDTKGALLLNPNG